MGKNLIPQVSQMLGVELGEEFEWHSKHDGITYRLKFKENEVLYCTRRIYKDLEGEEKIERRWIDGKVVSDFLKEVLGGHGKLIKLPWRPKKGEGYWTFNVFFGSGKWAVASFAWGDEVFDKAVLKAGWVYRTREEAEAALHKVAAEMGVEYEL